SSWLQVLSLVLARAPRPSSMIVVDEMRRERGSELMAHVGDELRLVLSCNLPLAALLSDLLSRQPPPRRRERTHRGRSQACSNRKGRYPAHRSERTDGPLRRSPPP